MGNVCLLSSTVTAAILSGCSASWGHYCAQLSLDSRDGLSQRAEARAVTRREIAKLAATPPYHQKIGELGKTGLPVDCWIGYAVKVLRDAGIETYESCQGGRGHCFPERQSDSMVRKRRDFGLSRWLWIWVTCVRGAKVLED